MAFPEPGFAVMPRAPFVPVVRVLTTPWMRFPDSVTFGELAPTWMPTIELVLLEAALELMFVIVLFVIDAPGTVLFRKMPPAPNAVAERLRTVFPEMLGLTAFCTMVTGILAVIFGNLALGRIARSQGREKGRGMAIAGIVLGWVSIAILGVLAIIWFGYNLSNG